MGTFVIASFLSSAPLLWLLLTLPRLSMLPPPRHVHLLLCSGILSCSMFLPGERKRKKSDEQREH
jgi:hypothetical protein